MEEFSLIGHPLGHTMSPFIHEKLFQYSGKQAVYTVRDLPEEALMRSIDSLGKLGGFNITIPYKSAIIPFLDHLSGPAEEFGAVNTVLCDDGKLFGYNTDCVGFLRALSDAGLSLQGKVLLCGYGGVARMMAYEALRQDCYLTIGYRNGSWEKAHRLKTELSEKYPSRIEICEYGDLKGHFDLLLNGTPLGMFPNSMAMPVTAEVISYCNGVFDTIYNPDPTLLIQTAKEFGIRAAGGMTMLVWQAAAAQEIWYDIKFTTEQITSITELARKEMDRIFNV